MAIRIGPGEAILAVAGTGLTIVSIFMLAGGYNTILGNFMQNTFAMMEDNDAFDTWETFPSPVYFRAFFFNITNPVEFMNGNEKPNLTEVGPYSYRVWETKEEVTFHANDTISYNVKRIFLYDPILSIGNRPSQIITLFNPIPLTAARIIENHVPPEHVPLFLTSLNLFMKDKQEEIIIQKNISDILFEGFEDPVLSAIHYMLTNESSAVYQFFEDHNISIPETIFSKDEFAWFYKRNNSMEYDGRFNMFTGTTTLQDIGKIDLWEYSQSTSYYNPPCNELRGSSGELFPPYEYHTMKELEFYSTDVCRSMKLYFEKEILDAFNITGDRFLATSETFTNGSIHSGNECYCNFGECAPTGLMNVETCRQGIPAYISFPHFFNADPYLLNDVIGLSPNYDHHAYYITINPDLGTAIEVISRLQINLHVKSYPADPDSGQGNIEMLENVNEVILPIFWFEMLGGITEDIADDIKPAISLVTSIVAIAIFAFVLVLSLMTVGSVIFRVRLRKKTEEKERKNNSIKIKNSVGYTRENIIS